ncbi:MAG: 3-hydroxyacyl-CoA dehydrogenase family protein [Candidatus Dormibacteria bacterium]
MIGAGVMGAGIAQVLAAAGYPVRLHDVAESILERAMAGIENGPYGLLASEARGKVPAGSVAGALGRITTTTDLNRACENVDLVVEAIPELIDLKLELFRRLDTLTRPDTILASNTAGLSITALAHATTHPARVLGWHWAAPCSVMRLAEIIVHPSTDDVVRDAVVATATRCGKNPEVIRDQPLVWGFVANRIMLQVRREALRIIAEGVATEEQVDQIMKDCFRWPLGPCEGMGGAANPMAGRPEAELLR